MAGIRGGTAQGTVANFKTLDYNGWQDRRDPIFLPICLPPPPAASSGRAAGRRWRAGSAAPPPAMTPTGAIARAAAATPARKTS